jgi:hypothetical protein
MQNDFIEEYKKQNQTAKLTKPYKFNWWAIVDYGFVFMVLIALIFVYLFFDTKANLDWVKNNKDAFCLSELYER